LATLGANVKCETDKDDGLKLPRVAAMNELKAVHLSSPAHREFRSVVKYFKTLGHRVNRMMNTIRAFFVNHGSEIDRGEKAWNTGRALIDSFRKPLAECSTEERCFLCAVCRSPFAPLAASLRRGEHNPRLHSRDFIDDGDHGAGTTQPFNSIRTPVAPRESIYSSLISAAL
jgi:hypothetical protein